MRPSCVAVFLLFSQICTPGSTDMLLVRVEWQFLVLRPLQQALPDFHRFRKQLVVWSETHKLAELSLQVDGFSTAPFLRRLQA